LNDVTWEESAGFTTNGHASRFVKDCGNHNACALEATMKKTFEEGKLLEFRPESWSEEWVTGTYIKPVPAMTGWHWVKRVGGGGDRFTIPTRRIRTRI
jgi:hypothetical protein